MRRYLFAGLDLTLRALIITLAVVGAKPVIRDQSEGAASVTRGVPNRRLANADNNSRCVELEPIVRALAPASALAQLNSRLADPDYRVIFLMRHGKASEVNKFTAAQRQNDPTRVDLDIQRPLRGKGRRAANQLANLLGQLAFRDVGMWGSHALRVRQTAEPTIAALGDHVRVKEFEQSLYYADVPREMRERLTSQRGSNIPHAFFWGHGKSTMALYYRLTGATEGFLPTASTVIVALKAKDWQQVFDGTAERVEAYVWSPNNTLRVEGGNTPTFTLEGVRGPEED